MTPNTPSDQPADLAGERWQAALDAAPKPNGPLTPIEQPAIPEGMVRWFGGDSAPGDWDGGPVLLRDGDRDGSGNDWQHPSGDRSDGRWDIIAYTPAIPASAGGAEAMREASAARAKSIWRRRWFYVDADAELDAIPIETDEPRRFCEIALAALPIDQPAQAGEVERLREALRKIKVVADSTNLMVYGLDVAATCDAALNPSQERAEADHG